MSLKDMIADHYGPLTAKVYDQAAAELFFAYSETLSAVAMEIFYGRRKAPDQLPRVEHVLDIGIGTGNLSLRIAEERARAYRHAGQTPPPLMIVGLDASGPMSSIAQEKLSRVPGVQLEIVQGTIENAASRLNGLQFDAIVSSFALHHLNGEGKLRFFESMKPLLKSDGVIVIGDRMPPTDSAARDYHAVTAQKFYGAFNDPLQTPVLSALMHQLDESFETDGDQPSTIAEHLEWIKQAGLAQVRCPFHSFGCAVVSGQA